jgi:hypothetical protein
MSWSDWRRGCGEPLGSTATSGIFAAHEPAEGTTPARKAHGASSPAVSSLQHRVVRGVWLTGEEDNRRREFLIYGVFLPRTMPPPRGLSIPPALGTGISRLSRMTRNHSIPDLFEAGGTALTP